MSDRVRTKPGPDITRERLRSHRMRLKAAIDSVLDEFKAEGVSHAERVYAIGDLAVVLASIAETSIEMFPHLKDEMPL